VFGPALVTAVQAAGTGTHYRHGAWRDGDGVVHGATGGVGYRGHLVAMPRKPLSRSKQARRCCPGGRSVARTLVVGRRDGRDCVGGAVGRSSPGRCARCHVGAGRRGRQGSCRPGRRRPGRACSGGVIVQFVRPVYPPHSAGGGVLGSEPDQPVDVAGNVRTGLGLLQCTGEHTRSVRSGGCMCGPSARVRSAPAGRSKTGRGRELTCRRQPGVGQSHRRPAHHSVRRLVHRSSVRSVTAPQARSRQPMRRIFLAVGIGPEA
jgi:hypothetical protein